MNMPTLRFKDDNGQDFPEWEENTLGEIAIFFDTKRIPLSESERKNKQGQYPYYGASGIIDYIDEYIFEGEFVLLGEDGANILTRNSKLAFVINGKFWINNHAHIMQATGSNIFLAESLERIQYEQYNSGTVQPKLNIESCKRILLNIPSLPEQTKIANFLTAVDDKIAELTKKVALLKRYKKGAMQQIFSQQLRFKDDNGQDFPEWEEKTLGEIAYKVIAGGTPSTLEKKYWRGDIRWMNSGELHLKRVYEVENRITQLGLEKSSTKIIPARCVLIGLAGQGKTRGTVAMNMVELCTNQSIAAIYPNPLVFNEVFLYHNLDFRYDELRGLSTGDGGRGGLNLQIIKSMTVLLPSLPEQTKIANFLSALDEQINTSQQQLALSKKYKQSLLQQMFI